MTTIRLKKGQTGSATFTLLDDAGAAFDLDGFTVTLVVSGGTRFERAATIDAPTTLGTGSFAFVVADYVKLRPGEHPFEVWAHDGVNNLPVFSGTIEVVDVPQRAGA